MRIIVYNFMLTHIQHMLICTGNTSTTFNMHSMQHVLFFVTFCNTLVRTFCCCFLTSLWLRFLLTLVNVGTCSHFTIVSKRKLMTYSTNAYCMHCNASTQRVDATRIRDPPIGSGFCQIGWGFFPLILS